MFFLGPVPLFSWPKWQLDSEFFPQMVVAFASRAATFMAKMHNVCVSIGELAAKKVGFLGVHAQEGRKGHRFNTLVQFSIAH